MSNLRRFFWRWVNLLLPGRAERALTREIASHLSLLEDEYRHRGLSAEDARIAARRALGGIDQTKERHRDARAFRWIDDTWRDVIYATRTLQRHPAVTVTALMSLAIGIGANAAVFTVANALLLKDPAAVARPGQLVDIGVRRGDGGFNPASFPTYTLVRDRATSFDGVYAHPMFTRELSVEISESAGAPERASGLFVTPNYFTVLGVSPFAGRAFVPSDEEGSGSPLVVLSHRYWTSRLHRDLATVGRTLRMNGHLFTVIGIAPEGFHGTSVSAPDMWVPLGMMPMVTGQRAAVFENRDGAWLVIGARLRDGASIVQASAELDVLAGELARESPQGPATKGLRVVPSSSVPGNRGPVMAFVALLMGLVSLVLLVACANISGVLIARGLARRRETAVRLSLGAGRARLVRQLLTETIVLFALGAVCGLLLTLALTAGLTIWLSSWSLPIALSLTLDGRVTAFTTGLSLLAALLAGLAPALHTSSAQPMAALKDDSQGPTRSTLRHAFLVAQVAISVALVVGAGLFARALARAGAADPGFEPSGVEITPIDLSMAGYTDSTAHAFWRGLLDRVRTLPGVDSATLARVVPGGFEGVGLGMTLPGGAPPDNAIEPDGNVVEPGYFGTLRIPLVAGRDFSTMDHEGAQAVAIVGEAAAYYYWPGESAIGKVLSRSTPSGTRDYMVVGVARDIRSTTLIDGVSQSFVYLPLQQTYSSPLTSRMIIVTRTSVGASVAASVHQVVVSMAPSLPVPTTQTLESSVAFGLMPQRVAASIAGVLGTIGLLLAAVGLYGVAAFTVTRRLREFGIRVALGAQPRDILGIVLRQGLGLVLVGCAIGVLLAGAFARALTAFLLGLPALDFVAFAGAVALFVIVGVAACAGPARRAIDINAASTLRSD